MKTPTRCDTIRIENGRGICPRCGGKLPGVFSPGCRVEGLILRCRKCRDEIEIQVNTSDQRPKASSVQ